MISPRMHGGNDGVAAFASRARNAIRGEIADVRRDMMQLKSFSAVTFVVLCNSQLSVRWRHRTSRLATFTSYRDLLSNRNALRTTQGNGESARDGVMSGNASGSVTAGSQRVSRKSPPVALGSPIGRSWVAHRSSIGHQRSTRDRTQSTDKAIGDTANWPL